MKMIGPGKHNLVRLNLTSYGCMHPCDSSFSPAMFNMQLIVRCVFNSAGAKD